MQARRKAVIHQVYRPEQPGHEDAASGIQMPLLRGVDREDPAFMHILDAALEMLQAGADTSRELVEEAIKKGRARHAEVQQQTREVK